MRITIVAQTPIIREGLRGLLSSEKNLQVTTVAPAESGALVERIVAKRPDVVLLDIEVLEREGWLLLRDLAQVAPDLPSLVISDSPADRRITFALELGAHGYLLRESTVEQMVASIRAAQQGLYILHPLALQSLLAPTAPDPLSPPVTTPVWLDESEERTNDELIEPLSERELDVLKLMARGKANKQIASELFITEHTVKFHIRSILGKLGASNRTEAVTLALQKGLVAL